MNIREANLSAGYSASPWKVATGNAHSSFASTLATASGSASRQAEGGVTKPDFTHMTRKELAEWVNSKIKSGEMSLDGSEAFVGMTIKIPVNGSYIGLDQTSPVDFMETAHVGISWARQHGEGAMMASLQTALATMQRYQGETGSVDLSA